MLSRLASWLVETPTNRRNSLRMYGRMRRVSPVRLALVKNAHGMTLLLQTVQAHRYRSTSRITTASTTKTVRLPDDTLCPKARGLSPQHECERAPRLCVAKPCCPCTRVQKRATLLNKIPMRDCRGGNVFKFCNERTQLRRIAMTIQKSTMVTI